jgi:hypothetical protein
MGLIIFESFVAIVILAGWAYLMFVVFDAWPDYPFIDKKQDTDWPFPRGPKP